MIFCVVNAAICTIKNKYIYIGLLMFNYLQNRNTNFKQFISSEEYFKKMI